MLLNAVMLGGVVIPELVRLAVLFPSSDLPSLPPDHPRKQVRRDGYEFGIFPGMTFATVEVQTIPAGGVERAVEDVRGLSAESSVSRTAWLIPEAAEPEGLAASLRAMGMTLYDEPPLEPRFALMVLLEEPKPGPSAVEARLAETFEEYRAGLQVGQDAFEVSDEDRAARQAHERQLWALQQSWGLYRTFVALLEGEIVGSAAMSYGATAALLAGGSTRVDMRGRGVYRALVRVRWDAAVAAGTPALTVWAGRMSRPILERLGFTTIGWADCLLDQFA